jgi:hypothetical protein
MAALRNFLLHGAQYSFPAVRGGITIGFPTATLDSTEDTRLQPSAEAPVVWPHPKGSVRGQALLPLYPALPLAAADDPALYALLAWFDLLRVGQARERKAARERLEAALH